MVLGRQRGRRRRQADRGALSARSHARDGRAPSLRADRWQDWNLLEAGKRDGDLVSLDHDTEVSIAEDRSTAARP
jgi:hypothetical protein